MKIYTWQGEDYTKLPDPLMTEVGQISPVSEALFLELGGTISDDGEPTHWEELDAACDNFIAVCQDIGTFIGDASFMGGINDMEEVYASEAAQQNPVQALILVERWNGANLQCNHFANKPDVNMQSPAWWWYCWQRYADQLDAKKGK